MDPPHLASQIASLHVGGSSNSTASSSTSTSNSNRLRNKRSQRFTVPVQPPNLSASPPFSNSDESATTTSTNNRQSSSGGMNSDANSDSVFGSSSGAPGTGSNGSIGIANTNSSDGSPAGFSSSDNHYSTAFPSNFAATGPAFLSQDPFAFAGGMAGANNGAASARARTMSAGSSHSSNFNAFNAPWPDQGLAGLDSSAPYTSPFDAFQGSNISMNAAGMRNGLYANQQAFDPLPPPSQPYQQQQQQQQYNSNTNNNAGTGGNADDIIPTAIVIKNIPFSVPSTSLLQMMDDLTLSPPYAFNYHYDSGVFRGLAFANFHTPQETDACVAALNGFEIQGRKLRVEYKKVLQAGEKERIERDKAIKRMRSMQLDRDRVVMQQHQHQHHSQRGPFGYKQYPQNEEWEDYGRVLPSNSNIETLPFNPYAAPNNSIPLLNANSLGSTGSSGDYPISSNASNSSRTQNMPYELDMNDPQTLEIYSRVVVFKEDKFRDELAFSKNLSSLQRRIVHLVAQKLGLEHRSAGSGDDRHVIVSKGGGGSSNDLQQQQARGLRNRASAHHLNPDVFHNQSHSLKKKSMPDLRYQQQHPYSSHLLQQQQSNASLYSNNSIVSSSNNLSSNLSGNAQTSVTPRHSAHDLRAINRRSAFPFNAFNDIPPVPALPPNTASTFSSLPSSASSPALQSQLPSSATPNSLPSRPSMPFVSEDSESSGLGKAVGSPVGSGIGNSPFGLVRQPRGPDSISNWARAPPTAASTGSIASGGSSCKDKVASRVRF